MRLQKLIITLYPFALTLARSLDSLPDSGGENIRSPPLEPINSDQLQAVLNTSPETLRSHAAELEGFARLDPDGNRAFGGLGHNLTIEYVSSWFSEEGMKEYYRIERLKFVYEYIYGVSNLVIQNHTYNSTYFDYSPSTDGTLTAPLGLVKNLGCDPNDYDNLTGKIALIKRGDCDFSLKSTLAANASAMAMLVFNNNGTEGVISGTYLSPVPSTGRYVPGAMISKVDGLAFIENLKAGDVTVSFNVDSTAENRTTTNLIIDTNCGDHNNTIVVGGHTDSVGAGPGVNDNGSGVIGLMEVAKALTHFRIHNAVRFCFWTAEEYGEIGSTKYLEGLSAADKDNIALYLNFDMIASPNYVYFVGNGDGPGSNITIPEGSGYIKKVFVDYFTRQHKKVELSIFDRRSDYAPFLDAGIPSGSLFTGAEGIKTQAQADEYGGTAGEAYDRNYHQAGDNATNLNYDAWSVNMKAMAHAVAIYANSTDNIPKRKPQRGKFKRSFRQQKKRAFDHSVSGHMPRPA